MYTIRWSVKNKSQKQVQVGVRELRSNLSGFLRKARLGASFLVMSHDEVVAELKPPSTASRPRRRPGALRGRLKIKAGFEETSDDLIAAMEGEES